MSVKSGCMSVRRWCTASISWYCSCWWFPTWYRWVASWLFTCCCRCRCFRWVFTSSTASSCGGRRKFSSSCRPCPLMYRKLFRAFGSLKPLCRKSIPFSTSRKKPKISRQNRWTWPRWTRCFFLLLCCWLAWATFWSFMSEDRKLSMATWRPATSRSSSFMSICSPGQ